MTPPARTTRRKPPRLALVLVALVAPAAVAEARTQPGSARSEAEQVELGRRIYREGTLPSGRKLQGVAQAGTPRAGVYAACAACHRRSGLGASEGPIRIPPITASALFGWREVPPIAATAPPGIVPANAGAAVQAARLAARTARIAAQEGTRRRPPYDEASLARALRDGVDAAGRPLGAGMPRFAFDDEEMKAVVAYLKTLSAEASPGVTAEEIHFATVVQPGVDPAKRRAMLAVLQGFVRDKNAGSRSEVQRREAGTERMYRAYRTWVLHVWDLTGRAETWGAQLETLYDRQPVFALIGGLGATSWRPIHDFSERRGVPCLFPQVNLPAIADEGFYTVYLSRGISLEAEALAKHLRDRGRPGSVTQVFRRDETSVAAASAFRAAMSRDEVDVEERALDRPPTAAFWERLARDEAGATLVLWLRAEDLAEASAVLERSPFDVYASATLLGRDGAALAGAHDGHVRMVHPLDLPRSRAARLLRVKRWLHEKGIALSEEEVQMNAYFAVTVTADAVSHVADLFSREYLIERIEHLVGNTATPSLYPRVSLGPGQRFASKGSFIVKLGGRGKGELEPVSGWITP